MKIEKVLPLIPMLKKGGIHIKKKNRGKFTEYCGGKVTEECIRKGKNSSNPTIRKRATFAANARKWKHENGGILKAQEGTGNGFWSKLWNTVKENGLAARDARIGAVGADQVRELYKSDKQEDKELAKELNDKYLAANAAGIGGGATAASALTAGVVPTLVSEVGGAAGSYVGNKAGSYLDEKLDTKWIAPTLSIVGGIGGGIGAYKGLKPSYNYLAKNGVIGYKDIPENLIITPKKSHDPLRHYEKYITSPINSNTQQSEMILFDTLTGKNIGQIEVRKFKNNPSYVSHIIGDNSFKHKGVDLYSAAILEDPSGIISGERLVSPEKTIPTWKHFKHKTIGNTGSHGASETGGDVVLLQKPARYIPKITQKIIEHNPSQSIHTGKTSYKLYERPSKLSDAEKLGIPKGERNQPPKPKGNKSVMIDVVNGKPSKEFIDDFMKFEQAISNPTLSDKNAAAFQSMTELFDSPWYKQRLIDQGVSSDQIDAIVKNIKSKLDPKQLVIIDDLNAVRKFSRIDDGVPIGMSPERGGRYAEIAYNVPGLNKHIIQGIKNVDVDDVILHEIGGHQTQKVVSDFKHLYNNQSLTNIGQNAAMKKQLPYSYYTQWDEVRARALTIAKQMSDNGWNPNSPEQVNVWLNKHIFTNNPSNVNQGATYYSRPEFIKAVATGLKSGGKLM